MTHMAERGWIIVSMAYRVSPRNTWPAHIVDVKRALAWIKENIAEHGGGIPTSWRSRAVRRAGT